MVMATLRHVYLGLPVFLAKLPVREFLRLFVRACWYGMGKDAVCGMR